MAIPLEASSWSEERILEEIAVLIASSFGGRTFLFDKDESGYWFFALLDSSGVEQWREESGAPNLVLLSALGRLDLQRSVSTSPGDPWVRRRELTLREVQADLSRRIQDPADLDPEVVASVYCEHPSRKG
jgi:hypothetical protein